jgi:uncharacterized membrane protein YeaQ/YmgE (transglycosylase-associated protein family)
MPGSTTYGSCRAKSSIGLGELSARMACPLPGQGNQGESMGVETFIIWLIVGAIAGWLAGVLVRGSGFGLIGDIIVGIVGGIIAGWLLPMIGIVIGGGLVGAVINALIGAVILLVIVKLIRR